MKQELDAELGQISRTATYAERLGGLRDVTALLMNIDDEENKRLEEVRSRLTKTAEVIPLDASVLSASAQYRHTHDFAPQDALVYSAVISHLERTGAPRSCFLNRNSTDFDDQTVVEQLERYNCKLLPRFDSGSQFILSALR